MNGTDELKACPFCGSQCVSVLSYWMERPPYVVVQCDNCKAQGAPIDTTMAASPNLRDYAMAAWNDRAMC